MPYFRGSHLSFRAKSRNGASGTSDIDGCAARVAERESGDERVQSLAHGRNTEMSRLRSTCQTLSAMTKTADKIIVALDVATEEKALELVEQLRREISFFKI